MDSSPKLLRLAVLGGGGVGKSALVMRFITNDFLDVYDPTLEQKFTFQRTVDGISSSLDILDTAGQDDYADLLDPWIRESDGFLLVFAINDRESYTRIENIRIKICRVKEHNYSPIVICGNKVDLGDAVRKVRREEVAALAEVLKCPYLETSARDKINSEECFDELIRIMRNPPAPPEKEKRRLMIPGFGTGSHTSTSDAHASSGSQSKSSFSSSNQEAKAETPPSAQSASSSKTASSGEGSTLAAGNDSAAASNTTANNRFHIGVYCTGLWQRLQTSCCRQRFHN